MVPSTSFDLISPLRRFRQIKLSDAGTFTAAQVPSLGSLPSVTSANGFEATAFSIRLPGQSATAAFTMAIEFQPTGEARNSDSPINVLEFAMQPQKGNTVADPHHVAVVRINGLTGQTSVYRR